MCFDDVRISEKARMTVDKKPKSSLIRKSKLAVALTSVVEQVFQMPFQERSISRLDTNPNCLLSHFDRSYRGDI